MSVSQQCAGAMHAACTSPETCTCPNCHETCPRCATFNVRLVKGGVCAPCYRAEAAVRPVHVPTCESCGSAGAFRVGRHAAVLCATCHAAAGHEGATPAAVLRDRANCAGADVSDDRHEWAHVKGTRFRCTKCKQADKFDPKLRASMRREDLRG